MIDEDGVDRGNVWLAWPWREEGAAFLLDIHLHPDARGRGLGRAAMLALEHKARELGASGIALNVFGGNEIARNLYRSLGYAERAVIMGKRL